MKKFFVIFLCLLFGFYTHISGQKNHFVPDEYIIQLTSSISKNLQREQWLPKYTTLTTIATSPMHLAILRYDNQYWDEQDIKTWLNNAPQIVHYQRNHIIQSRIIPDDPQLPNQYHLINNTLTSADIDADKAWDITTGDTTYNGKKIVIAIIDNGISADHPDLSANLWKNNHEIPNNNLDDDGNGYIDDINGWNVETASDLINNMASHGSQVAGVAGAKGNNGVGGSGVMWNTEMMIVDYASPTEANAIAAYSYVYSTRKLYNTTKGQKGAFIVASNSSWGRDKVRASEAPLWCAMYDSLGSVGIINCVATSNQNVDVDSEGDLPSSCNSPYLITVSSISRSDTKSASTGYGKKSIDIAAYGENIFTTSSIGYQQSTGTSVATPIVTGIAGLMYSTSCGSLVDIAGENPSKAARIVRDIILNSAVPLPTLEGISRTGGKANAHRVLENTLQLCNICLQGLDVQFLVSAKSLVVNFDPSISGQEIDFRIRPIDQQTWTMYTNIIPNSIIEDLKICSEYEIQVKNKCGVYSSDYGYSQYIRTNGCCELPKILAPVINENEIIFKWNAIESEANYNIQYKELNTTTWTTINSPVSEVVIRNLKQCQKYEIRLQIVCPLFGNESGYSEPILVSTECGNCTALPYCKFSAKNDSFEWFENTQFGPLQVNGHDLGNDGYKDYTGEISPIFGVGKKYTYTTEIKYKDEVVTKEYIRIYIDFDQDGVFSENEEMAKTPTQIVSPFTKEIMIPIDAKLGTTKMRQMIMYDEFSGSCDNSIFKFGEVEDFCITIENPACPLVSKASVENITKDKATVYLQQDGGENLTTIFSLRKKGTEIFTEFIAKDSILLTGLDSCSNYEFLVTTQCVDGKSISSSLQQFKTSCNSSTKGDIEKTALIIFPNPGSNDFQIELKDFNKFPIQISVYSSHGSLMKNLLMVTDKSIINTSDLPNGMYIIMARISGKQTKTAKWVKM